MHRFETLRWDRNRMRTPTAGLTQTKQLHRSAWLLRKKGTLNVSRGILTKLQVVTECGNCSGKAAAATVSRRQKMSTRAMGANVASSHSS